MAVLDDEHYFTVQSAIPAEEATGQSLISVSKLDNCGILHTQSFTSDYIWGVDYIADSWIADDSLYVVMAVNPKQVHSHQEIVLLVIHTENYSNSYKYLRADNVAYVMTLQPDDKGGYIAWCFFSYTDRAPTYGAIRLSRNFKVLDYYVNLPEYTVTGTLVQVPNGYFVNSSTTLLALDNDLQPLWAKKFPNRTYLSRQVPATDGVIYLKYHYPYQMPQQLSLVKLDFDGDILWESENLCPEDFSAFRVRLLLRQNGNPAVVVQRRGADNEAFNDDLYYYEANSNDGRIESARTAAGNGLFSDFALVDFTYGIGNSEVLLLQGRDGEHMLWDISPSSPCSLSPTEVPSRPTSPFFLQTVPTEPSIIDAFESGSYQLNKVDLDMNSDLACQPLLRNYDLLPPDTIGCLEGFALDISAVIGDITWEDGSTNKVRPLNLPGLYRYTQDHCTEDFGESINVTLETCECQLTMPNIINRNSLGQNSTLHLNHDCRFTDSFQLQVYDRWGNIMYSTDDIDFLWDGSVAGSAVISGVYVYTITYVSTLTGLAKHMVGDITIL